MAKFRYISTSPYVSLRSTKKYAQVELDLIGQHYRMTQGAIEGPLRDLVRRYSTRKGSQGQVGRSFTAVYGVLREQGEECALALLSIATDPQWQMTLDQEPRQSPPSPVA